MSNSDSSVKSHFLEYEIRDTSLDSGRDARPRVSTSESNPPKSKEARDQYALGNWYLQSRRYSLAINAYKRALELDPDCAAIRHSLGLAYYKEGDFDLARNALHKAIELNSRSANYHYVLG